MDGINLKSWSPTYWEANTAECEKCLADEKNLQSVPLLNCTPLHTLTDQQLVRFRGMIQDMYNPEYFLSRYEVVDSATGQSSVRSGKYRESSVCQAQEQFVEDSKHNVHSERQTWYCITVPGLNKWVTKYNEPNMPAVSPSQQAADRVGKRPATETEREEVPVETTSKRVCTLSGESSSRSESQSSNILNLPLPNPDGMACMIKVYDVDASTFSLNDVVEVVGFVSLDPALNCDAEGDEDEPMDVETQAHNPPRSLVPRLHAVAVSKQHHCNPLVTTATSTRDVLETADIPRKELLLVLSQLLFGDELAADYLICHLISTVYLRTDLLALGQLSLNLCNVPACQDYVSRLYSILEMLVPKSHCLPMSLENLNKQTFVPKKDYTSNRLSSGLLQLSRNTHLVLDEMALQPGKLDDTGVHNTSALGSLISQQKLPYDFQYYKLDFDCDVPVLVISEGKSLLPCSVVVPLEADAACVNTLQETVQAARQYLQAPLIDRIRVYLTAARLAKYDMSNELQEIVQEDFVKLRKDQGKNASPDDMHILMVLARLVSLSMGQCSLTEVAWKKALSMEEQRKQRLMRPRTRQAP